MTRPKPTWVLESVLNPPLHARLRKSALAMGCDVVEWRDDWLPTLPKLSAGPVIFHGSLNVAAEIADRSEWQPGVFCDVLGFRCTSWYESARPWLVHERWLATTVQALVDDAASVTAPLGSPAQIFVRPDSPLKPFSGRVVNTATLTLQSLDHGFYYDDSTIGVIIAPVRDVGDEWRFVVAGGEVVAASTYDAQQRSASDATVPPSAAALAGDIAAALAPPDPVYVLDICETDDGYRLLELNPFSGADLYHCNTDNVAASVTREIARLID